MIGRENLRVTSTVPWNILLTWEDLNIQVKIGPSFPPAQVYSFIIVFNLLYASSLTSNENYGSSSGSSSATLGKSKTFKAQDEIHEFIDIQTDMLNIKTSFATK